ncbi:Protein outspread [Araneus ventricosus]|uniref:Protein outspread n=1 Tax=Araneus ventricosus TaxID=182803 RepID=A0A4Y2BYF7_ARAVE|nr:Protein outspread [Araneus ventricosus]
MEVSRHPRAFVQVDLPDLRVVLPYHPSLKHACFRIESEGGFRWQRRWFVLYDDGELAYSVDEHPETVPQAVIDMNCVLEVADAENVTGNPYALAVTCPDKVHFIKGMNKEESKKWFEVLSKFPRNTVCGKYKRNATFPCIKSAPLVKIDSPVSNLSNRRDTLDITNYTKQNGYVHSLNRNKQSAGVAFDPDDDVYPTKDTNSSPSVKNVQKSLVCEEKKKLENSYPVQNESNCLRNNALEKNNIKNEDIKNYIKQDSRDVRKPHSRSDVSKMIPSVCEEKFGIKPDWKKMPLELNTSPECIGKSFHNPVYLLMSDVPPGKKLDSYENFFSRDKPRCLRRQSSFGKKSDLHKQILAWSEDHDGDVKGRTIHKSASVPNAVLREDNKILMNGLNKSQDKYSTDSLDRAHIKSNLSQIRGDPDGCNLDSLPSSYCASTAEFANDQSNESVFLKKGWLVKQDDCKWNKYWFVLRNSALTYFSDPIAEDAGILDGFVDLRKVKSVSEVESSSGYTFCIAMKDFSKLYLSAVTAKIRNNWIRAVLQAANLKTIPTEDCFPKKKTDLEKSVDSNREKTSSTNYSEGSISSLDSEKCTSTSSSKTIIEEDEQDKHNSVALPPSPPLARTAISRVKERAKTRSNSRTRGSRFSSTEIHESDPSYLGDSDDGTTDHSSSSLLNTSTPKEKKPVKENSPKYVPEEKSRPERRRSFKIDSVTFQDGRKKVTEIKDKLEDSSWTIWLDISKFCKEVESKLDDIEEKSPKNGHQLSSEQKKEMGTLVSSLGRVEERLHKVQSELEKAKVTLLLNSKDSDLNLSIGKAFGCHSLKQEVSRLSGISSQNALLAQQLNKAREENRRLKAEVKLAQASSDEFELHCMSLKQASEQTEKLHKSHMELMVARVDDLTNKLLNSEKTVRQLRQRVMKLEQRQERRRSSLKGKEALSLSKEYEAKLTELEQKIGAVEGVLKIPDNSQADASSKEEASKESPSSLMRLHNLDKKVKDVTETVTASSEETVVMQEDIPKPKIRLQVNLNENTPSQDTGEDWNSLSLSASMTDLTATSKDEDCDEDPLSLSFSGCLETLSHKVSSLISWLKTSLQLLYAQGHMNPFQSSKINFISSEASEELSKLVRTLDHVTNKVDESPLVPQGITYVVGRLLYNIILLQEITNIIFKMSDFDQYKTAMLVQHLNRVKQAIKGIEQYIQQKSNPAYANVQKTSLCNIVACLLFYRSPTEEIAEISDVKALFEEVDCERKKISSILSEFKEKFIERFCTTILELSEDSMCEKIHPQKSPDQKNDLKPLGQKQFLSHISHIISQVSQSFIAHISKSLNEVYFLCSSFQYSEKWTEYICKLLQQELSLLSSEIKSICIKHLENNFFSSSKCGVLIEYMHCSISELAQIVSIITVVDGTVILIKDAIYSDNDRSKNSIQNGIFCNMDKDALNTFHENLQRRTMSIMANLPPYRFPNAFFNLCNPNELNVAHRSVSSLLCFKQKWKAAMESERQDHRLQLEKLSTRIAELQEEQRRREEEGCKSCIELRQEVSYLQAELEESRSLARSGSLCEKCRNLRLEIQRLMEQHETDLASIEKLEEQELIWKEHLEEVVHEKEKQFSEEKQKLEMQLRTAQNNLKKMEHHYDEEIRNLQLLYEQKLQQKNENLREDIKLRYSDEIEQLKSLCEKGLAAMDASHKKIVSELEQRHQKELEELMADRERALAEEAHATAIALEAVRKAHSEELQKQIQKFKDEFVLKMNKRFETQAFKKCYESDLSAVKYEILSMTEKYSAKCLENATLQEKLEIMNQQLKSTTTQVVELLAKNQQLQARLSSEQIQKQEESII